MMRKRKGQKGGGVFRERGGRVSSERGGGVFREGSVFREGGSLQRGVVLNSHVSSVLTKWGFLLIQDFYIPHLC